MLRVYKPSYKLHFVCLDLVTMATMHGHSWRGKETPSCMDESEKTNKGKTERPRMDVQAADDTWKPGSASAFCFHD